MMKGHKALWLENTLLRLAILPEKGADIPLLFHLPSGVQFLMQTPHGLQSPNQYPQMDFLENYEGGWQELLPNCSDACQVQNISFPVHGEAALLSWEHEIPGEYELHLWVNCRLSPFRLERWMRLNQDTLEVTGQVINSGEQEWPFVWGNHIALGGDFLEDGCRLEMPANKIATPAIQSEPGSSRLADAQWEDWPMGRGRQPGEVFDLRYIPGPQTRSHDDAFITGFSTGHVDVTNPRLKLRFNLDWDAAVFPWLTLWMPYGGVEQAPIKGTYGVGIEPWVYRGNLTEAIKAGQARSLGPGESLTTQLTIKIEIAE